MKTNQASLSEFGEVLLFMIGGLLFVIVSLFVSRLLRPYRPNPEKLSTYESGEQPITSAWTQFNIRFYVIALIFLLFEIELVLLFPWSTVFADERLLRETNGAWGWLSMTEALLFIVILVIGLAYAWRNGFLDWIKPEPSTTQYQSPVPKSLYDAFNEKFSVKNNPKNTAAPKTDTTTKDNEGIS